MKAWRHRPHRWLDHPSGYRLKTHAASLGRASVRAFLCKQLAEVDGPILDVACGTGRHTAAFPQAVGVDTNFAYVADARRRGAGHFAMMDATQLAFPEATFAAAYAVGLCHHLPDHAVTAVLGEMKRVLRPGGQAWIVDAVFPPRWNVLGTALFHLDRGAHTRPLDALVPLLAAEGFDLWQDNLPGSFPYQRAAFRWQG